MQQKKVIRNLYSSLSDSELISIWCMFKDRSDGVAMAEAETELARRGGRSDEPEVRFPDAAEILCDGKEQQPMDPQIKGCGTSRRDGNPEDSAAFEML